jgi:hypothetical protein
LCVGIQARLASQFSGQPKNLVRWSEGHHIADRGFRASSLHRLGFHRRPISKTQNELQRIESESLIGHGELDGPALVDVSVGVKETGQQCAALLF